MTPKRIIIHCSATKDSGTVSWGAIRRYHVHEKGWNDIGYHAGVELVGEHYEILMGRMWDEVGAHCVGQNFQSLGLCVVGDFEQEPPPTAQWNEALRITRLWMGLFLIPETEIYGHRQFAVKSCPGKMFNLDRFREEV